MHVESPYVDYLTPNFTQSWTNLKVREALQGGDRRARRGSTPAVARRPTGPPSRSSTRPWSATSRTRRSPVRSEGDPSRGEEAARRGRRQAAVPDHVHLPDLATTADKQAAALKEALGRGGLRRDPRRPRRHLLRRHPEARQGQRRHLGRLGCRLALRHHRHRAAVRQPSQPDLELQRPGLRRLQERRVQQRWSTRPRPRPRWTTRPRRCRRPTRSSARTSPTSRWRTRSSTSSTGRR